MPNFSLARNGCDVADLAAFDGVDYTTLANVGVADKTNRDLFLVRVKLRKLSKELNQRAFAK